MIDMFVVWTTGSLVTAVIGGFVLGFVLVSRFDNPRFTAVESVGVVVILGVFAGLTFFAGQAIDTYASGGADLAWRVVSRFGLWCVFVLTMGLGTGLGIRVRQGTWA